MHNILFSDWWHCLVFISARSRNPSSLAKYSPADGWAGPRIECISYLGETHLDLPHGCSEPDGCAVIRHVPLINGKTEQTSMSNALLHYYTQSHCLLLLTLLLRQINERTFLNHEILSKAQQPTHHQYWISIKSWREHRYCKGKKTLFYIKCIINPFDFHSSNFKC